MAGLKEVGTQDFDQEVLQSATPVLVDFWAPWCGPCRAMAPVMETMAAEADGKLKVVKLNVDDHGAIAARYNIQSIPTLLLFEAGQVKATLIGYLDERKLWDELSKRVAL